MKTLNAFLLLLILATGAAAAFVYSGQYPIGADRPHWPLTEKLIELLRDRAIAAQASSVTVPALNDPKLLAEGAEHYDAMCTACHLAPGQKDTELRQGLYPQPPRLDQASDLTAAEQFWVIKHGVKLTAMPAWGASHDDEAIWGMVAFLQKLPTLTAAQYQALMPAVAHHHDHADGHEHAHEHHHGAEPPHHH